MKTIQFWCQWELTFTFIDRDYTFITTWFLPIPLSIFLYYIYSVLYIFFYIVYSIYLLICPILESWIKWWKKLDIFVYILPFNIALLIIKMVNFGPQIIFVIRNIFLEISLIFKQKKNHHDKCARVLIRCHVLEIIWWQEDTIWPCTKSFY